MQVDALPGQRFEGVVDRVSPVVDAGSGTFRVTAAFASESRLRPGMFGRLDVIYDERDEVLTIPREALVEGDGIASVFSVRDGHAVRVPVTIGFINGRFAEIRDGLAEGEQVVTVGKVSLRDGSAVEVLGAPTPDAPTIAADGQANGGAHAE
jgi:membrane fusion protein, multidrug efflux system